MTNFSENGYIHEFGFISVLKVDIIKVGLVFWISNLFITKTSLANNWRRKKIPSCSNSALEQFIQTVKVQNKFW